MNGQNDSTNQDEYLWKIAKKRVAFRRNLYNYIVVNAFLWLIWYFTTTNHTAEFPWPLYPMIGWGLAIALQYYKTYSTGTQDPITAEYEKLKDKLKK